MNTPPEPIIDNGALNSSSATPQKGDRSPADWPVALLGVMMFLVPAIGVTHELMLQDTLKSAMVSFGVLMAAMLFFWQQRQRTTPLLWHGLVCLPLVLMVYALASMAWSHTYLAGVETIRWFILSLLLWLGLNTLTRHNLPMLMWGIHGGAVVASLWAALQFWLDFGLFPQGPNPASTFINRNFFAEYAVCALPFSIYALLTMRASRWLIWQSISVALIVVAIMMTGTRSALIAMLVLAPVFMLILLKYWQQFALAGWSRVNKIGVSLILAAGVLGMGSMPSGNVKILMEKTGTTALQRSYLRAASIGEAKEFTEGSFSIRAVMWKATARMMMANPLTGVGAGAWEVQIPLYQRVGEGMETDYYAHNEFLQLLSEYGVLIGGLFIAVLFAYLLLTAGKTWRLQGLDLAEAPLRSITLTSLLALLIVSNAGFPWRLASTGALLALCLAILAVSDARLGIRETFFAAPLRWRPSHSHAMLSWLICCIALAAYITQQAAEAERKIVGAIQLGNAAIKLQASGGTQSAERKARWLESIRDGVEINPHYRKLTPMVADQLADSGDWAGAVWIWESIAASRPYVAVIWSNIARAYTQLGENDKAFEALHQWQQLQPDAPGLLALEITLLSRTGREAQSTQLLVNAYEQNQFDFALLQAGYALGLKTHNWSLAIWSLELRNQNWPDKAADGYFRLGEIYAAPELHDNIKALTAFSAGLAAAPENQKENFRSQVPMPYRTQL
ncbi:MAG: O-antigen ligase family protein [Pseudomonadota bacterium]